MRRGEVWWANLAPRSGSEQQGTRPVVVISHDAFNEVATWRSVIVVPVSSSASQSSRGPTAVPLPKGAANLTKDCSALCHQVTTLDRAKLTSRLGVLTAAQLDALGDGLRIAQGLA